MTKIISGTELSKQMRAEIAAESDEFRKAQGRAPGLVTVLVGNDPASEVYVRMKGKAAEGAGFYSQRIVLEETATQEEVLGVVNGLNADPRVDGILVQLPLPSQLDAAEIIRSIDPAKDVDGFHPINVGLLAMGDRNVLAPCTPAGVVEMLLRSGYELQGARVVIVGRSNLVGRPLAMLLLRQGQDGNATVTVAHSRSKDLGAVTRDAEILVAAAGRPNLITRDMVTPGTVVIDVGVNRVDDPGSEKGFRLVGDVAFDEVAEVAGAITPVPGGVGPMTITMLMRNTLDAARRRAKAGSGKGKTG